MIKIEEIVTILELHRQGDSAWPLLRGDDGRIGMARIGAWRNRNRWRRFVTRFRALCAAPVGLALRPIIHAYRT